MPQYVLHIFTQMIHGFSVYSSMHSGWTHQHFLILLRGLEFIPIFDYLIQMSVVMLFSRLRNCFIFCFCLFWYHHRLIILIVKFLFYLAHVKMINVLFKLFFTCFMILHSCNGSGNGSIFRLSIHLTFCQLLIPSCALAGVEA